MLNRLQHVHSTEIPTEIIRIYLMYLGSIAFFAQKIYFEVV